MASIESIGERIFREDGAWLKLLIGGVFCLTVIGIPVAFGFLFAYVFGLRSQADNPLPKWENWTRIFIVGLHFLAVFLVWFCVPILLAALLSWVFSLAPGGLLDIFGWLALGLAEVVGLALFSSALVYYQRKGDWAAIIEFEAILAPLEQHWKALIVPGLAWVGLMAIGLPLLPFTFFLGMVIYLAYAIPLLSPKTEGKAPKPF